MITINDIASKPHPAKMTLNDIPVGQLFRGRVLFVYPTCNGYLDGIFRKYRAAWSDENMTRHDCLVVSQQSPSMGGRRSVLTSGMWLSETTSHEGAPHSFFTKCSVVENYEPLIGVLTITKP